jgi:hypothetical protein
MKIKVIFIPYCSLATMGLSLLDMTMSTIKMSGTRWGVVHESKHFSADVERQRNDEEHKERHLCDKE